MSSLRRWLTAVFLFALPLLIYPGNTGYSYTKSAFALAMISLLLLLWSIERLRRREQPLYLTKLFYPGLALIAVASLSLINASSLGIALQSLVLLLYFFLFSIFLANIVANERDIHLLLGSILAAAFFAALYGILQYYGVLPGAAGAHKGSAALISTLGNRNFLGGFLVYLVLPALILPFRLRNIVLRGLSLLALATIIYTLTLIGSDGAWLALAVSGAFFAGAFLYFKLYRAFKLERGWIVIVVAIIMISAAITLPGLSSPPRERAGTSPAPTILGLPVIEPLVKLWQQNAGRVRAWDWWIGWEMLKDHPLLGVGLGHYKIQFLPYKAKFLATERGKRYDFYILRAGQAHNEYVQIAAEMGILGILAAGFLVFILFYSAFRGLGRARSPGDRFIILALLAGVVAVLTHALFSFPLHLPASALDFVLLIGLLNSRYLTGGGKGIRLTRPKVWIASSVVLAIVATTAVLGVRDFLADVHLQRGKLLLALNDDRQAEAELRESIALDFQPQSNLFYLGGLYAKERRYQESLALFHRSLNCYVIETTYWYLGTLSLELGYYDDALKYLVLLARISPSPKLKKRLPKPLGKLYDHAVALLKAGREEEALRWFDELATLKLLGREKRLEADYFRASIRINGGRVGEGIAILQQLIAEEPSFWRAYVGLGQAYQRLGKSLEARKYYTEAATVIEKLLAQDRARLEEASDESEKAKLEAQIKLLEEWKGKLKKMLEG